jgi:peptide/nickel transport system substrate-binding protein
MMNEITVTQSNIQPGDPHVCSDSTDRNNIIFSIYEGLVKRDQHGFIRPALATRWVVEPDGLSWLFELRESVEFHNGEPMKSNDVVASIKRVVDPNIGGAYGTQGTFASYLGEAKLDAPRLKVFKVRTSEPMADLLDLLSQMPIAPSNELDKLPNEYIGTGPYRVEYKSRDELHLKANHSYWGKKASVEDVTFIGEPDALTRAEMVAERDADIGCLIGVEGKRRVESEGKAMIDSIRSGLCIIFILNCLNGPCTDQRVRVGLNHGLDVEALIQEVKKDSATRLSSFITPLHYGYDSTVEPYLYDPDRAKRLLMEVGIDRKLTADVPISMPDEAPELAIKMKDQFTVIGIDLEIKYHYDRQAYAEMVRDKKISDLCCFDSSPRSTFRVVREKLNSRVKGPWWQGYHSPEVNDLAYQAQRTFDYAKREDIYKQIYRIVHDEAPWLFLYRPIYYYALGKRVKDWIFRDDGTIIL